MNGTVLILGAGTYQVPLIKQAREMGFRVAVASIEGPYPGIPLADKFLPIDITDVAGLSAAVSELKPKGVLTTGSDIGVLAIGAIVDRYGFAGTGYAAAKRSTNKIAMKRALQDAGIPTARFNVATTCHEAKEAARTIGYPVMVKPVQVSGSQGVTKVTCEEEIESAWDAACRVSRTGTNLVEKFLEGVEYGATMMVHGQTMVACLLHNHTVTLPPRPVPIGHSIPCEQPGTVHRRTENVLEESIAALGIRQTVCNCDLILVNGEPKVIEIAARMGATCLPENIQASTKINVYDHIIQLALGMTPTWSKAVPLQPSASLLIRSEKTGLVEKVFMPREFNNDPSITSFKVDVAIGDHVKAFAVGPDRIGHVVVTDETVAAAEARVTECVDAIAIEVCHVAFSDCPSLSHRGLPEKNK